MMKILCFTAMLSSWLFGISLDNTIEFAISNSKSLAAKKCEIEMSKSRLKEAEALSGINLSVNGDYGTIRGNTNYQSHPTYDSKQDYKSIDYGLEISKSIFNYRNLKVEDKQEVGIRRSKMEYLQAEQDLILRVSQAYFEALLKKDILQARQATLKKTQANKDIITTSFSQQLATKQSMLVANAIYLKSKADVLLANSDYRSALDSLAAASNYESAKLAEEGLEPINEKVIASISNLKPVKDYIETSEKFFVGNLIEQLTQRAYELDIDSIKAEAYPTINGQIYTKKTNSSDPIYGDTTNNIYYMGVGLRWTLYDGGSKSYRSQTYSLMLVQNKLKLDQTKKDINARINNYYSTLQGNLELYSSLRSLDEAYNTSYQATKKGFELKLTNILSLEAANEQVANNTIEIKKTMYGIILAYLQLNYYTGKLNAKSVDYQ